jgi:hypothetical protein
MDVKPPRPTLSLLLILLIALAFLVQMAQGICPVP